MKGNKVSGTGKKYLKLTAHMDMVSEPKTCPFSKQIQEKPVPERKNPALNKSKIFEAGTSKKENYSKVARKTKTLSLSPLIRIRATDGEGNTIEVTY